MKQYNEKPSSVRNIGEDVGGAARHRNDTYENPEVTRQKAFKKRFTQSLKLLLAEYKTKFAVALSESTECAKAILIEYELKKAITSLEALQSLPISSANDIRDLYYKTTDNPTLRESLRKSFNSLSRKQRKIRYFRPIELPKYFESKSRNAFTEFNGIKTDWVTTSKGFDTVLLATKTRAVQFGNSIPDTERIYCGEKLLESINILERYFTVDFKALGFSFGARGKAGSIAHYQDSQKVLAFNRHWDGALIHELGHAIDYLLDLPSRNLPYELRSKYRQKLSDHKVVNVHYYMKNKEIFARLFEAYCRVTIPELTTFMFFPFNDCTLPDLDAEALAWIGSVLKPLLKGVA